MPSHLHEALLLLFRNRPELAAELLRGVLHAELPPYTEVCIDSADITEVQPAEYRADLVIELLKGKPVIGIVVEVQLGDDEDKLFTWPAYAVNLRSRIRCPVVLLVITIDEKIATWAAKPIHLGGDSIFVPAVIGPSGVPEITDKADARRDPELAVLSAMAHSHDPDIVKSARIADAAITASRGLDAERATLYFDLAQVLLPEAARRALQNMDPAKYEYQSEFAKRFIALGKEEGRAEGKAEGHTELVLKLLSLRYGALPEAVRDRVSGLPMPELDAIAARLLRAATLEEALG